MSDELLYAFAAKMGVFLQERVVCATEASKYMYTLRRGHEFLQAIANTGKDFGLQVDATRIDVAIVPAEESVGYRRPEPSVDRMLIDAAILANELPDIPPEKVEEFLKQASERPS